MSRLGSFHPLVVPIESVKDQSLFKARMLALLLVVAHPLYYLVWSQWSPQPYESLAWRLACAAMGGCAFVAIQRYGASDARAGVMYGIATAAGTVVLGSWFFVANGGNPVWLASLVALTMIYFTLTDWRIAIVVTLLSYLAAYLLVPALGIGVWATQTDAMPFNRQDLLILGFALGVSTLTRYTDANMRVVQLKGQLRALAITAHEMRTPLAGMQLLASALEERLLETQPARLDEGDLQAMCSLATELRSTCQDTNNLINTHLANANPFKPFSSRETVSVTAAVREAIASFQKGAGTEGSLVDVIVDRDFTIQAEAGAIRQVVVNLLNNAFRAVILRHTVAGPHQIAVTVSHDGLGRLIIADQGTGMSSQEAARMFEPFNTGDPKHGHGLGLTYVRAAVTAYGGSIKVARNEHGGTSMIISFLKATPL